MADDREPSNGQTILSFDEAIPVARKLLFPEDGADTSTGLLTLDRAVLNYADDLAARGALVYNARYPRPHLPASLLAKPVALITETELKSWRNNLAKNNLAPSSVNRICNCLRAALELADKRRLHIWRAGLEKLPDAQTARNVVLSDADVWAFIEAAYQHDPGLGLFIDTLGVTGTRPSEATRLLVRDFKDDPVRPKLMMPASAKGGGRNRSQHRRPFRRHNSECPAQPIVSKFAAE